MFTVRVIQAEDSLAIPTKSRNWARTLAKHYCDDYIVEITSVDEAGNEYVLEHYEP